jgi:imidazolonepropionase-like amidohydrolase
VTLRFILKSPFGETVVRGVVDGRWVEPGDDADDTLGEGMWALPGLVDAHAHLAAAELDYKPGSLEGATARAAESLRAGVTLVLDKGWTDDVAIRLIDEVPESDRPEIEAAARIIASVEGYFPGFATEVDAPSLPAAVRDQAAAGRGWVKLIGDWPRRGVGPTANFSEVELAEAVAVAEEAGARVAIHTMAREVPSMAVAAGVHSIEHGLFLEESDISALAARGGMWVPTVTRCEATLAQLGETSSGGKLFLEGLDRIRRLLPLAAEAGVNVLAGTDLVGSPANVADEALRLADYGLSNTQVVTAVSVGAFAATGRPQPFVVGSPADAVFFGADPIAELGTLASPRHVVRLGRVL